jgi:SAM (Sterile alpha motif) domain-containing protein
MDVAEWLRRLGLAQYEPAFRANEIDEGVLPRLTAEDLKDLGVTLVGHRRRLPLLSNQRPQTRSGASLP